MGRFRARCPDDNERLAHDDDAGTLTCPHCRRAWTLQPVVRRKKR